MVKVTKHVSLPSVDPMEGIIVTEKPEWEWKEAKLSDFTQAKADFYVHVQSDKGPLINQIVSWCESKLPLDTPMFSIMFRNPESARSYFDSDIKERIENTIKRYNAGLEEAKLDWTVREVEVYSHARYSHMYAFKEISQQVSELVEIKVTFEKPSLQDI